MTEKMKAITNRLNEAEEAQRTKRKLLRDGLSECHRKELEYSEALKTETDPEKYNELVLKEAENNNRMYALQKQYAQKEAPALSRQEVESIRKELTNEFVDIQKAHAPAIIDALKTLIPLVNAYTLEVDELDQIMDGARRLTGTVTYGASFDRNAIRNHAGDLADILDAFMWGYNQNFQTFRSLEG